MEVITKRFQDFDTSGDGTLDLDDLLAKIDSETANEASVKCLGTSTRTLNRRKARRTLKSAVDATIAGKRFSVSANGDHEHHQQRLQAEIESLRQELDSASQTIARYACGILYARNRSWVLGLKWAKTE